MDRLFIINLAVMYWSLMNPRIWMLVLIQMIQMLVNLVICKFMSILVIFGWRLVIILIERVIMINQVILFPYMAMERKFLFVIIILMYMVLSMVVFKFKAILVILGWRLVMIFMERVLVIVLGLFLRIQWFKHCDCWYYFKWRKWW